MHINVKLNDNTILSGLDDYTLLYVHVKANAFDISIGLL